MMFSSSIRDTLEFIHPDPTLQGRAARVATATATGEDREEGCNMWKWKDMKFKKIIPKYTNSDRHRREIELEWIRCLLPSNPRSPSLASIKVSMTPISHTNRRFSPSRVCVFMKRTWLASEGFSCCVARETRQEIVAHIRWQEPGCRCFAPKSLGWHGCMPMVNTPEWKLCAQLKLQEFSTVFSVWPLCSMQPGAG